MPARIVSRISHKPPDPSVMAAMLESFGPVTLTDNLGFQYTLAGGPATVPEGSTLAVFGLGVAGLGLAARRRKAH